MQIHLKRFRIFQQNRVTSLTLICFAFLALLASRAGADATVTNRSMAASTIAQVYVERDHVRIELEISANDLLAFKNIVPDDLLRYMKVEAPAFKERLPQFFTEGFTVIADGGKPVMGRITSLEWKPRVTRDVITGDPVTINEAQNALWAVLEYPLTEKPNSLTFTPPLNKNGYVSANIGFVTYHQGLPVNDFRHLSSARTLDLDWEDPWYSKFRHNNFLRKYNEPINAFLYIEPYETRVEVIIRPKDLQQWVDLGIENKETLPVQLQGELKEKAAVYLADQIVLEVDGERVTPTLDRIHFLRRSLRASTVVDPAEELDAKSAMLGVILVHRTTGLPQKAELTWKLFSSKNPKVRSGATDEAGPLPYTLQPDDNILKWENFLKNPTIPTLVKVKPPQIGKEWMLPLVSMACGFVGLLLVIRAVRKHHLTVAVAAAVLMVVAVLAKNYATVSIRSPWAGAEIVSSEQESETINSLLRNVYVAFDFRDEEKIYDTLSRSADGDLLTRIYLETKKSLELQNQGGARVKVKEVKLIEATRDKDPKGGGFVTHCKWNVGGSVGHWGHVHQRINQYEALIHVDIVDGEWKITELELLQEERVL